MKCLIWFLIAMSVYSMGHTTPADELDSNETTEIISANPSSKILSRRKRFLIFPDGSSFQLVFCAQNQGYLQIGDIVWFGNTAALAWELPTDPALFTALKQETRLYGDNRRQDSKHILFLDENGKVLSKIPYHKRPIVNPAFAKRSISGDTPASNKQFSIKEMHEKEKRKNHFNDLEEHRVEFHRSSRKNLYGKLEKVFEGLGWNGKECILRLLCEATKGKGTQATFLGEIVKATFTLPRGTRFDSEAYDAAHGTDGDCSQLYPDCDIALM